jgi:hypothetical protein
MAAGEQAELAETVGLECPSRRVKWVFMTFGIESRSNLSSENWTGGGE